MFLKSTEDSAHFKCISANRGSQPGNSSSHRVQNTPPPPTPTKKIVTEDKWGRAAGRGDEMEAIGSGKEEKQKSNERGSLRSRQEMKFILVPGFPKSTYVLCSHQPTYFIPAQ